MLPFSHRLELFLENIDANASSEGQTDSHKELIEYVIQAHKRPNSKSRSKDQRAAGRQQVKRWLSLKWHGMPTKKWVEILADFLKEKTNMPKKDILHLLTDEISLSTFLTKIQWEGQNITNNDIVNKNITFNFARPYFLKNKRDLFKNMHKTFYMYRMHSKRTGICRDYLELLEYNGFFGWGIIKLMSNNYKNRIYDATIFSTHDAFYIIGTSKEHGHIDTIFVIIHSGQEKDKLYSAIALGLAESKNSIGSSLALIRPVEAKNSDQKEPRYIHDYKKDEELTDIIESIDILDTRQRLEFSNGIITISNDDIHF